MESQEGGYPPGSTGLAPSTVDRNSQNHFEGNCERNVYTKDSEEAHFSLTLLHDYASLS